MFIIRVLVDLQSCIWYGLKTRLRDRFQVCEISIFFLYLTSGLRSVFISGVRVLSAQRCIRHASRKKVFIPALLFANSLGLTVVHVGPFSHINISEVLFCFDVMML